MPAIPNNNDEKNKDYLEVAPAPKTPEVVEASPGKENSMPEQEPDQQELREAMEKLGLDDAAPVKAAAAPKADTKVQEEKIRKLMDVAKEKGVIFAVALAKRMDDPYMLDMFHDALAQHGLYEKFKK